MREEKGCNFIIALTHARRATNIELVQGVPGIDLILGGHDHDIHLEALTGSDQASKEVPLLKSGHDFHDLSIIDITLRVDDEKLKAAKNGAEESRKHIMYSEYDEMMFEIT